MKTQDSLSLEDSLISIAKILNIKPEMKNGMVDIKNVCDELTKRGIVEKEKFSVLELNKKRTSL
jgi:hypothetical protein